MTGVQTCALPIYVIVPLGATVVTAMIARFGPDAVAGFGVASRIESLMLVIYYAMSAIIGPFVGQNLSADSEQRILEALWLCTKFCIMSGLAIAALLASLMSSCDSFMIARRRASCRGSSATAPTSSA